MTAGAAAGLGLRGLWRRWRSRRARALALLVLSGTVLGCGGPLGPIAGGRLSGTVVAQPVTDWSFAAEQRLLQVETRPGDPYSVNVAFALAHGRLYLDLGTPDRWHRWRTFVRNDPHVRLRVGDSIYPARLVPVTDPAEITDARDAFAARGIDPPEPGATIVRAIGSARSREQAAGGLSRSRQLFGPGPTTMTKAAPFASGTPGHAAFSFFFSS